MTVRLYRLTGQYEAFALAHSKADAVKHGERGRKDCERVYDVTAEVAVGPVKEHAKSLPDRADVYSGDLGVRDGWKVEQWAAAAATDAAAEADRLRAEAADCDRRAAKLRAEAEELAKIAARARGTETAQEPEPSEANRVAAFLGALRDAGLPEPEGAP